MGAKLSQFLFSVDQPLRKGLSSKVVNWYIFEDGQKEVFKL